MVNIEIENIKKLQKLTNFIESVRHKNCPNSLFDCSGATRLIDTTTKSAAATTITTATATTTLLILVCVPS
jgi:hypothetical protein